MRRRNPDAVRSNFRVVVEPLSLGDHGVYAEQDWVAEPDPVIRAAKYEARCHKIVRQIKRHIDDISIPHVRVEWDEEPTTSAYPRQSTTDAYQLAAENAMLARTVTRMTTLLHLIADSQPHLAADVAQVLEHEHESIILAAGIWPPVIAEAKEAP